MANITLVNNTFGTTGAKFGSGFMSGGYGSIPSTTITVPGSFELWVKAPTPAGFGVIFGGNGSSNFYLANSGNQLEMHYNAADHKVSTTNNPLADGGWHHVRVVMTASAITMSIDGVPAATAAEVASVATGGLGFGALGGGSYGYVGAIDEFAVFSTVLPTTFTPPSSAYSGGETGLTSLFHLDGNGVNSAGAASNNLVLAPNSMVAGTTNNSIAVTGTALTGTTFTVTGGAGASLTGQTINSATSATITVSAGSYGGGQVTVTNSGGGSSTLSVTQASLGSIAIGCIGDSITVAGYPASMGTWLTSVGYAPTIVNAGASGQGTTDFLPGGTLLTNAIASFNTAGVTIVSILLGTNDCRTPNSLTPAQHYNNMTRICRALIAAGFTVFINKCPWTNPNSGSTGAQWPNDPNSVYGQYFASDIGLVDGVHVFQGDAGVHVAYRLNTALLAADGIHPANQTAVDLMGQYIGAAIVNRLAPKTYRQSYF